jgi:Flp pilus assembly protein TadG
MRIVRRPRHVPAPAASADPAGPDRSPAERGQSLVEFALVMMPLFVILLGIIQFGFIFNAYVTITNATREGARLGTVYVYQPGLSKSQNDLIRNNKIKDRVLGSMNLLTKTAPNFSTSTTWTQTGSTSPVTFTNGDLIVEYTNPIIPPAVTGVPETDARVGQQVRVRALYHQDLIIPLIAQLLPRDAGGRLGLTSETTMVVN